MGSGSAHQKDQQFEGDSGGRQEVEPRPAAPPPAENIDKIREILFGSNIREYERRFAQIEARLSRELGELKDETRRRLNALEISASREIESLNARIEKERQERGETGEKFGEEIAGLANTLERKARQIEDRGIRVEREFRDQLLAQSRSASEELRGKLEEVLETMDRLSGELRDRKVDRGDMAAMFTEIAMRLNNEPMPNLERLGHGGSTD
jgi:hypothetical protein